MKKIILIVLFLFFVFGCTDISFGVKDCSGDSECWMDSLITCTPAKKVSMQEGVPKTECVEKGFLGICTSWKEYPAPVYTSTQTIVGKVGELCKVKMETNNPKGNMFVEGNRLILGKNGVCYYSKGVFVKCS